MASGDEDDPIIEEVSPQFHINLAETVDYAEVIRYSKIV